MSYEDVDYYTTSEKKWKKYKKESYISKYSSNTIDPSLVRSFSHKHNNSSSKSPTFPRSYSQKSTNKSSSSSSSLYRSASVRSPCPCSPSKNNGGKSTLMRSLSKKSSAFGKKCTNLAKEQKARFYIMKRCVSMLVSWRKNGDS